MLTDVTALRTDPPRFQKQAIEQQTLLGASKRQKTRLTKELKPGRHPMARFGERKEP